MSNEMANEGTVLQECLGCRHRFNALMYSCPNCGTKGESVMTGGMDIVQIISKKEKSREIGDRGGTLFQQGQIDKAIALMREAITVNPMNEQVHSNLGYALIAKGDYQEAIRVLEHVLSFSPHREEARRYLATAQSKLKQVSAASPRQPNQKKWWQFWNKEEN